MTKPVTMTALINALGDDAITFQNLDHCASDINYSAKRGTRITFGTEEAADLEGTKRLGLILWLDRDLVAKTMARLKSASASASIEQVAAQVVQPIREEPSSPLSPSNGEG